MAEKTVAQKSHFTPGTSVAVLNRVAGVVESLGLPRGTSFVRPAQAQVVMLFVRTKAELESKMPAAVKSLQPAAALWVFFRKGARESGLDMNRDSVWAVAEKLGLGPLGLVAVDETWSVFRLRRRDEPPRKAAAARQRTAR
jgi:hypothetical protein